MSFLEDLGTQFVKQSNAYSNAGENTPRSLFSSSPDDPYQMDDVNLGAFADKVDRTAQRSYIESGYISNVRPRNLEILMQEPDLTIIVKKRMFSSLVDNYRLDMMDRSDRNFIKASKRLFQNKCQVISTYEKLSKLERIAKSKGIIDDYFTPMLSAGIETLENFGVNIVSEKTKRAIDTVRKMQAFSDPGNFTTWFTNPDVAFDLGEGTGTFSLTLVSSCNTKSCIQFGAGNASLSIEDPYHLLNIGNQDIDRAISDVYNKQQSSGLFQFSENELSRQNNELRQQFNQLRFARGAVGIQWQTNAGSILSKKVRAFLDSGTEIIFEYNPGLVGIGDSLELDPSATEGINGLTGDEAALFKRITKNIYEIISLKERKERELSDVMTEDNQDEINYVRSKMRLHFANKNIIQIMDTVHVFMGSKTMVDNKVIGFDNSSIVAPGNNLLTMINSTVEDLEQSFNNLSAFWGGKNSKNTYTEVEKNAIVGEDFPTWLWAALRNDFTRQAAGVHVFCGLVSGVTESYGNGKYTLSVECKDNTEYFNLGKINVKPAVDVPERSIFDPLTPFDLEFDGSTGFLVNDHPKLLDENESILFTGMAKCKNGSKFIGSPMSEFLYLLGDTKVQSATGPNQIQRVFFDPDGFVYRWKSGIGTFTYNSSRHPNNAFRKKTSPLLTRNPYAGQDVMNVLSLLITGIPYNYNTFITSAIKSSNLGFLEGKDNVSNLDMAQSFFRSFISDLQINNTLWGNFIPFKKLVMNETALKFAISGQFSFQKNSAELDQLLSERAKLFDLLVMQGKQFAGNPSVYAKDIDFSQLSPEVQPVITATSQTLTTLDDRINQLQSQIFKTMEDGSLQVFGDDISYSPDLDGMGNMVGEEEKSQQRALLRRKMKLLTQRRVWKVAANDDQNLLIIDDQYDKDYDIQAFERALSERMSLMKSDYADVSTEIASVAKILGLEVFANSQGHIEIKSPGYNKIPSSVFSKMISDGKKLYPKALETLFMNQADELIERLCIVEDQIRLRTLSLGLKSDTEAQQFLSGTAMDGGSSFSFRFITNSNGQFGTSPKTIQALVIQDSPDLKESNEYRPLKTIDEQVRGRGLFDSTAQVKAIYDVNRFTPADDAVKSSFDVVRTRLLNSTGQPVPSIGELMGGRIENSNTQTSILKITKELALYVSERQNILKLLRNAFKNLEDGALINEDPTTRRNTIFPSFQKKQEFPSVIQHLIEDESEDDLGPGAGGRYIIKDNQIISFSINEHKPDFSAIEVVGLPGEGFIQAVGEVGFNGNMQTSAIAVDYDLWRMYGFMVGTTIPAPYISDADAQAAPLATWLLTEQRRKLISGSIEIAGNEYMQSGEVIYLEDRDLLFYVESVAHNFNYGSQFTTQLAVSYGHNPGEYFPTMLDIIGKGLYTKRNQANLVSHARHGYANGSQNLGILVINPDDPYQTIDSLVCGKYGEQNKATLTQMLLTLKGSQNGTEDTFIEVRYYSNPSKGFSANKLLEQKAGLVKVWLKSPSQRTSGLDGETRGDSLRKLVQNGATVSNISSIVNKEVPKDMTEGIKVEDVERLVIIRNITDIDVEGPSPKAWYAAREMINGSNDLLGTLDDITQSLGQNNKTAIAKESASQQSQRQSVATQEEKVLYKSVLDIWISFKPKE